MKKLIITISSIAVMTGMQVSSAFAGEANKLSFDANFIIDALNNTQGGIKTGSSLLTNIDLTADWENSSGLSAHIDILSNTGGSFTGDYVGDLHVVSNIDAPTAIRLYEAWVKKSFDDKFSATFGLINQNGIFDVQEVGGLFLNSSHGIGVDYSQNGVSIFPLTSLGLVGEYNFSDSLILKAAVFDAVPGNPNNGNEFSYISLSKAEGVNYVSEIEKHFDKATLKLGYWGYSAKQPELLSGYSSYNQGVYGHLSMNLYKESEDQGLDGWIRAGHANEKIAGIGNYIGGGIVYTGPFKNRDEDQIGFAIANGMIGKDLNTALLNTLKDETNFELTYSYKIKDGVFIQPDVQYIKNPSGLFDDALTVGIRFKFGLSSFKN